MQLKPGSLRSSAHKDNLPTNMKRAQIIQENRKETVVKEEKQSREEELMIKAVLILGVTLTGLYFFIKYNSVGHTSKKL
jgi:hypothetical protein